MLPRYLADIICHARPVNDGDGTESAHASRNVLLMNVMLEDLDISARYAPVSANQLEDFFQELLVLPQLQRDLIAYYIVLDTSDSATGKDFVRSRHLTQADAARIQGFWHLDNGRIEEAVRLLSTPSPWSGFADDDRIKRLQDAVLENLEQEGSPTIIKQFIQGSGMIKNSPWRRECTVRALALDDGSMREAWRYVRDLEFENEMILGEELGIEEEDEMDVDADDEEEVQRKVEIVQDERKRLLAIMLDAILIPRPHKIALQVLVKLPIDRFEIKFMTSYLLNTTSTLPAASFSLLHDLLTLRLCSSGQHANAIDLDRQVAERIRERPELAVGSESRAKVQAMVELLPEVQRKMLLVERDAANTQEASKEQEVQVAKQPSSTTAASAPFTRPSFAPLSASVQLRQASNPRNAIYQALLRSTSSSSLNGNAASARTNDRFLPVDHAPASSRRQLNNSTSGMASSIHVPYGGQQTQFPASPFNFPPRVPVAYAASSACAPSAEMGGRSDIDDETYDDGSVTPRDARSVSPHRDHSMADEREETPVARQSNRHSEPRDQAQYDKEQQSKEDRQNEDRPEDDQTISRSASPVEPMAVDEQSERGEHKDKEHPTQKARENRSRQKPSESTSTLSPTRTIAKTPRRTRKQEQQSQSTDETEQQGAGDDQPIPIPGAFPTATTLKRKLRSSSQRKDSTGYLEKDTQASPPKRTRKITDGVEAARRATRSQSVASQATTEGDHNETTATRQDSGVNKRRPQRRSARLSESTAPSSPARSAASDATSTTATKPRTRKAASTPKKSAPPATRGVRTRRQAAALEEEDEE
ncbi:hypothetical protein NliqN6_0503 [Naganishia liquefaciens]|uniref:ELYS-like domain-containing protein n=1 Tax=Naganishia liquefaciens TaxID=104408 RepID=A0A8H3YDT5_9TREE|nr:hypothetical protein NliqN6_0503 [Naganishia liquefaciens]